MINDQRYIKPLLEILGKVYVRHYLEVDSIPGKITKVIISGNSIFSSSLSSGEIKDRFKWMDSFKGDIFGICAGQQIIAQYYGSRLVRKDSRGIRKFTIRHRDKILKGVKSKFNGYVTHNFSTPSPRNFIILASASGNEAHAEYLAKHPQKDIYISSFHPEFSEKQILRNFANI